MSFFDTNDKSLCTGCRACEMSCPKSAIKMVEDDEGFYYPAINEETCIHCDLCRKTCPVTAAPEKNLYIDFYAVQSKNKKELANSSSGGCFITLAKKVIEDGGAVFGCVFDKDFNAITVCANTYEELVPMQGSKYVQCDVGSTYKQAEELLKLGKKVLYTGTPCQIAGFTKYLCKDYDNLITMDFLCHGVPSNKLFRKNVKYLENKYKGKISNYSFRDKSKNSWGMMTSFFVGRKKVYQQGRLNAYAGAFTLGSINRLSCYSCKFVGQARVSDITVADFWGIKDDKKAFGKPNSGISILMLNTLKSQKLFEQVTDRLIFEERNIEEAIPRNNSLFNDVREWSIPENRKIIYENIENYAEMAEGILKPADYNNLCIKQYLPEWFIAIIRRFRP